MEAAKIDGRDAEFSRTAAEVSGWYSPGRFAQVAEYERRLVADPFESNTAECDVPEAFPHGTPLMLNAVHSAKPFAAGDRTWLIFCRPLRKLSHRRIRLSAPGGLAMWVTALCRQAHEFPPEASNRNVVDVTAELVSQGNQAISPASMMKIGRQAGLSPPRGKVRHVRPGSKRAPVRDDDGRWDNQRIMLRTIRMKRCWRARLPSSNAPTGQRFMAQTGRAREAVRHSVHPHTMPETLRTVLKVGLDSIVSGQKNAAVCGKYCLRI